MNIKDHAISTRQRLSNLAQKFRVDYFYMATTFKKVARHQIIHFDLGVGGPITPDPVQAKTAELY